MWQGERAQPTSPLEGEMSGRTEGGGPTAMSERNKSLAESMAIARNVEHAALFSDAVAKL
jgi:hypothetical protein